MTNAISPVPIQIAPQASVNISHPLVMTNPTSLRLISPKIRSIITIITTAPIHPIPPLEFSDIVCTNYPKGIGIYNSLHIRKHGRNSCIAISNLYALPK